MKSLSILFFASLLVLSCSKDRLRGDKEILVGKWRWVKTTINGSSCSPPETVADITPITKGRTESVEFLKKGFFRTYINGEQQQEFKLKFESWGETAANSYSFTIELDKNENYQVQGGITTDTLTLSNFFILYTGSNTSGFCYKYKSYFVRE